jgi:hypothetical protein
MNGENELNGLGSGWAHAGRLSAQEMYALQADIVKQKTFATALAPTNCWGIDTSHYVKNVVQVIKDAVAAGASFVIAKASDGVQLIAGSSSAEKNYVDPDFYDSVQVCYELGVPIGGYHFFHHENDYFAAPDPESPSADMQWRTVRNWLGLPLGLPKAPRAIQMQITDLEGYLLNDGKTWNYQEDGPVVIAERLQIWMEWMKHNVDPKTDPYLAKNLLYTSPGFVKSYCPNVITQIDGGSITGGYTLWLATWFFVKKVITSFAQVPALLPATGWPILGNWGEKVWLWQCGTVAYNNTEVDINLFKGTKEELYKRLNFTPKAPPVVHTCDAGSHWDEATQACVPDVVPHTCPEGQTWDEAQQKCVDKPVATGDLATVLTKLDQVLANQAAFKVKLDKYPG